MDLFKHFRRTPADKGKPIVVTFTGGMGAQMISAAIYFSMRDERRPVYADLSYFDQPESVAIAGDAGVCSHWSWQLEPFGLSTSSFNAFPGFTKQNADILQDGPVKLELGLKALAQPEVQKYFEIPTDVSDALPTEMADGFLCVHVRRGDYVNVASHLVADNAFVGLSGKFSGLIKSAVVISDSPIGPDFRSAMTKLFEVVAFLDHTDAYTAHRIMRNARILICSNSQFSLIAAALNPNALVLIPKQWFGDSERHIEAAIHTHCTFQIMENGSV
ncbi:MAG: alpha-1,2-fucosyltransferase [Gammaproteobacteria bacterium]|nr:alpha-1,2-fucosyltransferase [Gammaproteobacteria bacterium]MBU1481699.1 alpha-1,2-fucosyltransferase [Gammaproteobacteria bacterium]